MCRPCIAAPSTPFYHLSPRPLPCTLGNHMQPLPLGINHQVKKSIIFNKNIDLWLSLRDTWGWIYRTWSIYNLLAGFFFLFRIDISISYCYIVVLFLRLMKVILRDWMLFVVSRCIFLSLNIRGVRFAFKRGFPFKSFPEKSLREKIIISR